MLSGGPPEVVLAVLVGLEEPVERERVADETVLLRPAEAEMVAEAWALEAMLVMRLESEAEAEAEDARDEALLAMDEARLEEYKLYAQRDVR